jgi:asparagine synthase (glutamine-hydrolysing)
MDGGVGLAHLALHVTPEDAIERQPLADGTLVLVADARIDNRAELQAALRDVLRSPSPTDADLILAAYRRWGTDCARHLIGDFAFAIWDTDARRLFAARDPMAMRALYYRAEPDRFLFATEVKQILAAPGVPTRIYEPMVAAYLAGNFDDLEHTFYEGIRALPPAHALSVATKNVRTWRYWNIDSEARIAYADDRDYVEHFRTLFAEAVQARLRSAQPMGLFLSGGLDSGSVAAMAGALQKRNGASLTTLRTYSWAFETLTQCDERFISAPLTRRYHLSATDIDAESASLLALHPYLGPDSDHPYVGAFHGLIDRAFQTTRRDGVRCVLSGHRGDLVSGLWLFDYVRLLKTGRWIRLGRELREHVQVSGDPWGPTLNHYLKAPLRASIWPPTRFPRLRRTLKRLYRTVRPHTPPSPFPAWVRSDFVRRAGPLPDSTAPPAWNSDLVRQQRYQAVTMPWHMQVAASVERHAALHGLIPADPWSDRRVLEFALSVPPHVLCRTGTNKWLIRRAMEGIMPPEVLGSAQKVNPSPLHVHALKAHLSSLFATVFSNPDLEEYVDASTLQAHYDAFREGGELDRRFWFTATLALWMYHQKHRGELK